MRRKRKHLKIESHDLQARKEQREKRACEKSENVLSGREET